MQSKLPRSFANLLYESIKTEFAPSSRQAGQLSTGTDCIFISYFEMATNALRNSVRRFATSAAKAASVETKAAGVETANSYGVRVSRAQGVVDSMTGGKKIIPYYMQTLSSS